MSACFEDLWVVKIHQIIYFISIFYTGTELSTCGNEKCSCVMCFSQDALGGMERRAKSSRACDTIGEAVRESGAGGGSTGTTDARYGGGR